MTIAIETRPDVLASLNVDLAKEHGAIVQYLLHSAQMRDSVMRWSIMNAAREEMWHMDWLTEAIRERGGTATLDRQESIFTSDGLVRSLQADVDAENDALAHYEKTLETIGDSDEDLTALIQRIMDDERYHRTSFGSMADKVGAEGEPAFRARPEMSPSDAQKTAPMIALEYEGLLQYLQNKYGSPEKHQSEQYFELAINEMRHLNWVASCGGGLGVPPVPCVPKDRVHIVQGSKGAHVRAEEYERRATDVISQARDAVAGERISSRLRRVDYQHGYHRFLLDRLEKSE